MAHSPGDYGEAKWAAVGSEARTFNTDERTPPMNSTIDAVAKAIMGHHSTSDPDFAWAAAGELTRDSFRQQAQAALAAMTSKVDARSLAVEIVDMVHGYTVEFSNQPEAHLTEYDTAEAIIERALKEGGPDGP